MSGAPKSEPVKPVKQSRAQDREARLKAALKANMARRKAQAKIRGQALADEDQRDGPQTAATGPDNENK